MCSHAGRCFQCDYLLRELAEPRCPECGRPFDPDDPATMNMTGRPLGNWRRHLLRPSLYPLCIALVLLVLVHGWYVRLPGPLLPNVKTGLTIAWVALLAVWCVQVLAAAVVRARVRPPAALCRPARHWRTFFLVGIAAFLFLLSDLVLRLEVLISLPALNRYAAATFAAPLRADYPDRRVGLFRATQTYATPTDMGFKFRGHPPNPANPCDAGLIYCPGGPPTAYMVVGAHGSCRITHMFGHWYLYERQSSRWLYKREWDRQRLAEMLAANPAAAAQSVQALIDLLKDKTWWRQDACTTGFRPYGNRWSDHDMRGAVRPDVVALVRLGAAAVGPLVDALPDPIARPHALFALGEMGRSATAAVPALIPLLADADATTREVAACTLGRIGPPAHAACAPLLTLLEDPEWTVRCNALIALRSIHPSAEQIVSPLGAILRRIGSTSPQTWADGEWFIPEVFALLGVYGDEAAPALTDVRAVAGQGPTGSIWSLASRAFLLRFEPDNPEYAAAQRALWNDRPSWRPRSTAEPATRPADPQRIAELVAKLRDPSLDAVAGSFAQELGLYGPAAVKAVPVLLEVLRRNRGSSGIVETGVAVALGRIGEHAPPELQHIIVKALIPHIDPSVHFIEVRRAALGAIARLDPRAAAPAINALERMRWYDPSLQLRQAAAAALDRLRPPATAPTGR